MSSGIKIKRKKMPDSVAVTSENNPSGIQKLYSGQLNASPLILPNQLRITFPTSAQYVSSYVSLLIITGCLDHEVFPLDEFPFHNLVLLLPR